MSSWSDIKKRLNAARGSIHAGNATPDQEALLDIHEAYLRVRKALKQMNNQRIASPPDRAPQSLLRHYNELMFECIQYIERREDGSE